LDKYLRYYLKIIKNFFDLKKTYILIFLTLTAWSIFAYNTITNLIKNQKIYAEIINLSGKQRMLSQKTTLIGKRYLEEKNPELKNHLKELITLMKKDHHYIMNHLTSKEIHEIYFNKPFNLDYEVKNYLKLLDDFYQTENLKTLKEIEQISFTLLPKLNYAVNIFEGESDLKTKELLTREQFILIGTIFTLLFEALFIVIPSIKFAIKKEDELNLLNKKLEEKIGLAIEENNNKEKVIQQQYYLNQTAELINNIAHQWRQPLSIISTIASGIKIQKEFGITNEESMISDLNSIVDKTQYLSNTIDQLNNFIHTEDNSIKINLKDTINSTIQILSGMLEYNQIGISISCPKEELFVDGNINDLRTILLNIINNAQDVLVERNIQNKQINLYLTKDKNNIYLSIEDNAGGIDDKIINKIFDMYFTTKHKSQGTGLGLYLTYIIVEKKFKGKISVNNTDRGSKFTIKLPIFQTINQ
jgi:signal transduction histidine kinase